MTTNENGTMQQQLAPMQASGMFTMPGSMMTPAMMESMSKQFMYRMLRVQMAMARPRDPIGVEGALLKLCENSDFAQVAVYAKPVAGKKMRGLSARFAEAAMPIMKNLSEETTQIYDDIERQTWKVAVEDIETNTVFSEEVFVNKRVWKKHPRQNETPLDTRENSAKERIYLYEATDDEVNTLRAALCSKVRRNLIIRHISPETRQKCIDLCIKIQNEGVAKDPDAARKKIVGSFLDIGINTEDLSAYLGHSVKGITEGEIDELRGVFIVIRDGDATWASLVAEKQEERAAKKGGMDKVKKNVRERQQQRDGREGRKSQQGTEQQQAKGGAEPPKEGSSGADTQKTEGEGSGGTEEKPTTRRRASRRREESEQDAGGGTKDDENPPDNTNTNPTTE